MKPRFDYWQAARWMTIVVLSAVVIQRVFVRGAQVRLLTTPRESVIVGQRLPDEVRNRLAAVGWSQRVGERLGLWVSVNWQRLVGIQAGTVRFVYPCSTAARGVGNKEGSNQTPLGWHEIAERLGDGLPIGAVFVERQYTGKVWRADQPTEKDFVLTRILWLRGAESGVNQGAGIDSHARYIYIHGTPAEEKIGAPASMGCIRLKNKDVAELFDQSPSGTVVLITEW